MEAAKKKLIRAGYKVGMAYMWGEGVEEDIPAAAYWFKQAANGGDDDAQVQLGMMFIYGHGVEENVDKGFNWLQLSAEQDNPIALRELGLLYESGKGVALSMSEATRLISKAASLGDKKSIEWVDTHYPDKPDWLKTLCSEKQ
jgi:TPR repeat protein